MGSGGDHKGGKNSRWASIMAVKDVAIAKVRD